MRFLLIAALAFSTPALAEKFKCGSEEGYSPYKPLVSAEHDHKRFVPVVPGIAKEYTPTRPSLMTPMMITGTASRICS